MFVKCIIFALLAVTSLCVYAEIDREKDIQEFVAMMSSDSWAKHKEAAQRLEWAGLSDPRIFDLVEKQVIDLAPKAAANKNDIDLLSWLMKALSFSGQDKYYKTVEKIAKEAKHKKIKKYAQISLTQFSEYKKWNPIINSDALYNSSEPSEINRFANMLRSDEMGLKLLAAKRIHYKHIYNDYLMEVLANDLQRYKDHSTKDREEIEALAWMCKALAGSRNMTHKPVVEALAKSAKTPKIKAYANKYLGYYN